MALERLRIVRHRDFGSLSSISRFHRELRRHRVRRLSSIANDDRTSRLDDTRGDDRLENHSRIERVLDDIFANVIAIERTQKTINAHALEVSVMGKTSGAFVIDALKRLRQEDARAGARASASAFAEMAKMTTNSRTNGIVPNAHVCTTMISIAGDARDVEECANVLRWMEKRGEKECEPTTHTYTACVHAYDKVGDWESAFEVMKAMEVRGVKKNAHTYSALIRAGANGGKKGARAAVGLIPEMKRDFIEPDLAIASALICAFGVLESEESARAMLRAIESSGREVDAKLYTDYITAMCRCGNYAEAKEVFGRVSRTTFTCTAVMRAYADSMEWKLAEQLFEDMRRDGPKPNDTTHTAILHAYEKSLQWQRATSLLDDLARKGQAKEIHHNIVLSVLGKCSQWERAEKLFKDMRELYNIQPSRVTYSTLISAYGRSGKTELARKVFLQMLAKRIAPDDYTFVGLMLGPATAGNFRECAKISNEMKEYGVAPTVHTYNALIQAADIAGNYDKAVELYDELLRDGLEPNNTTRELVVAVANRGASYYDRQQKTAAVASYAAGLVGVMGMALGRW